MFDLKKILAIDIGTCETIIIKDGQIVLRESSVVVVEAESRKCLAIGNEAKKMLGRTSNQIEVLEPIKNGIVVDFEGAKLMLKNYLQTVMGAKWFIGPEIVTSVSCENTQVEQRAVIDVLLEAGARKVNLIDSPLVAAIGAKVPISDVFGNMIVNLGGGISEVAVIASGGVVRFKQIKQGGEMINDLIGEYMVSKYSMVIGKQIAEEIKIKLLSAVKLKKEEILEVGGRDMLNGLPKKVSLSSTEIFELMNSEMEKIVNLIKTVLEVTPADLVSDILDRGIILTGGYAKTRGMDLWLSREIGVPVHMAPEPQLCVIKGLGMVADNWDLYRQSVR